MLNCAEYDSALSTTVSNHIHKGFILVQWLIFVFAHSKNVRTLLSRENMTLLSTELLVLQVKSRAFSNNQIWFLKCYQQRMCDIHCDVDKHFYPYLNHLCICRIFFLNFMMKVFCSFPDYGEVIIILLSKNTSYCIAQFSTASFINNLLILFTWTEHIYVCVCVCVWCVCVCVCVCTAYVAHHLTSFVKGGR